MQQFELVSEYSTTALKLFNLLRTPAFQEALAFRFGALEVKAVEIEKKSSLTRMKIERLDPGWSVMGGLVKGKPVRAVVIHDWNTATMQNEWNRYFLDQGKKMTIEGKITVEPMGAEACRMIESGLIEIKTPLLGKGLEKKLYSKLQEVQPRRVDFIMQRLGLSL